MVQWRRVGFCLDVRRLRPRRREVGALSGVNISQRVNTVEVKVHKKSSTAGSLAFQAGVIPNTVYAGRSMCRGERKKEDAAKVFPVYI